MAVTLKPAFRVRPMDVGEILDDAFRIYRANFGLLFGLALLATVPAMIQAVGSTGGPFAAFSQGFTGSAPPAANPALSGATIVGTILGIVLFPITTAIPQYAACCVALGLPATAGSILRESLGTYWKVLRFGALLVGLVIAAILILTIPLVIMVFIRWSFVYQVIYLEHSGVRGAMNRSSALVRGSWWRIFGIVFLAGLLGFVVALALDAIVGLLGLAIPAGLPRNATTGVLSAAVQALLIPFGALVTTLLYLDQRIRKENLDLQLMAGQAGGS